MVKWFRGACHKLPISVPVLSQPVGLGMLDDEFSLELDELLIFVFDPTLCWDISTIVDAYSIEQVSTLSHEVDII